MLRFIFSAAHAADCNALSLLFCRINIIFFLFFLLFLFWFFFFFFVVVVVFFFSLKYATSFSGCVCHVSGKMKSVLRLKMTVLGW